MLNWVKNLFNLNSGNITSFTVKRSKWGRGGLKNGALLRNDGSMCCLGFYCEQSGVPRSRLLNHGYPRDVGEKYHEKVQWMIDPSEYHIDNSSLAREAAGINDDSHITDEEREKHLIKLFNEHGIKLTFED